MPSPQPLNNVYLKKTDFFWKIATYLYCVWLLALNCQALVPCLIARRQTYKHNGVHLADLSDEMCLHGCMPALRCHLCPIALNKLLACRQRCVQVGLWLVRGWGRHPPKEDESHFCVRTTFEDGTRPRKMKAISASGQLLRMAPAQGR